MSNLIYAASILKTSGVVNSYREFSSEFCGKNVNWLAYQQHKRRDFSISAAINCLSSIHARARALVKVSSSSLPCSERHLEALQEAKQAVNSYLWDKHQLLVCDNCVFIKQE